MFRLIRLPIMFGAAFVLGVFSERNAALDKCLDAGGAMKSGVCRGVSE
ncbi:hypothetical protein LY10_00194 [Planktotalea frisia]|jgi:hypothetical protein|uniref:Uncharacterized protein n=1 Tax=Planktotalea frisia TaxID=696762 RepID=A0A1L9NXA9_9RHOB|nr:hypothetical protein PFRI_17980 [Planktotalea frisia]PZX35222.1 hypothetical protein LY10_00194 [Planktotalea frisia]